MASKPDFIPLADWSFVLSICGWNPELPYLIGAIGWHETHWGRLGAGKIGWILGYGYWPGSTVKDKYKGLENQLKGANGMIKSHFQFPVTLNSVTDFAVNHWKSSAPRSWASSVFSIFLSIKGGTEPQPTETEIQDHEERITRLELFVELWSAFINAFNKRFGEEK